MFYVLLWLSSLLFAHFYSLSVDGLCRYHNCLPVSLSVAAFFSFSRLRVDWPHNIVQSREVSVEPNRLGGCDFVRSSIQLTLV